MSTGEKKSSTDGLSLIRQILVNCNLKIEMEEISSLDNVQHNSCTT